MTCIRSALLCFFVSSLVACGAGGASGAASGSGPAAGAAPDDLPQLDGVAETLAAALSGAGVKSVAVLDLSVAQGQATTLGRYLGDKLLARIAARAPALTLVERSKLASVIDEQAFSMAGLVGSEAIEVGAMVGAGALVIGNATLLAGGVDVSTRAVDATSGRILATAETTIPTPALAAQIGEQSAPARAPPLTLSTIFLGERNTGGAWEESVVRDGSTLRSGDGLKLVFETNRPAYVYALLFDSLGKGSVIFPNPEIQASNGVRGGRQIEIPPGEQWFFLDENTGTETIYVLASIEPLADVGTLVARLEQMGAGNRQSEADAQVAAFAGAASGAPADGVLKRGIGGIQKGHTSRVKLTDGGVVEQVTDMMTGAGAVVRAVTFLHE